MRLDKFLKVTRIIKRRSVAKNVASNEKILINGSIKKPSTKIKVDDIIEIEYYNRKIKLKVLKIPERNLLKNEVLEYYEIEST